jgi:hypothetical protein
LSYERRCQVKKRCPSPKSSAHLKSITYEEVVSHVTWMTLRRRGTVARDNASRAQATSPSNQISLAPPFVQVREVQRCHVSNSDIARFARCWRDFLKYVSLALSVQSSGSCSKVSANRADRFRRGVACREDAFSAPRENPLFESFLCSLQC